MLHEILLSLSGHPSPLFDEHDPSSVDRSFPLLSPPEKALLTDIGKLSCLHRDLRTQTSCISASHSSVICRAVAASINSSHLGRFQQKILDVEERILKRDASLVGAYNIVPLAGVVGEFGEWTRLMEWYWDLCCFILPPTSHGGAHGGCSGSTLIDKLRSEAQTGYMDIEEAALSLSKEAEKTWMRQLSTWVLYGRLPSYSSRDFFINAIGDPESSDVTFDLDTRLLPKYVSLETAASILFIGRSLNHIRSRGTVHHSSDFSAPSSELELLRVHLKYLAELALPLSASALANAISAIRLSLSRNTLQQLLPLPKIIQMLVLLREFFLLGRGEFAMGLISEADDRLRARNRSQSGMGTLKGLLLNEAEVNAVLMKTWSGLAAVGSSEDYADDLLELARETIRLTTSKSKLAQSATLGKEKSVETLPKLSSTSFNDALFSTPTTLIFEIPSPFDLFMSKPELSLYSSLHAYLLAIRRGHMHLTELWRQSFMRREYPTPLGPPHSCTLNGKNQLRRRRERSHRRNLALRKLWATCSAAIFLLSEIGEQFEGQVVNEAWKDLRAWITSPSGRDPAQQPHGSNHEDYSMDELGSSFQASSLNHDTTAGEAAAPRDPEMLASAHRRFLASLAHSLLITDASFTRLLRSLLNNIDALVAFVYRLQHIYQNLDLEEDEGVVDPLANYAEEHQEVTLELDRSRKRVDSDMKAIVARLRELDLNGVGQRLETRARTEAEYEPPRGPGVERLLMKLDFAAPTEPEDDEEDRHRRDLL